MIVSLTFVTFNEPLGIGVASVPPKEVAAAETLEASVGLPEVYGPVDDDEVPSTFFDTEVVEAITVDCDTSEALVLSKDAEVAAAGVVEIS